MPDGPTHAVLRDGPRWEGGQARGLEAQADGTLVLASLPAAGTDEPVELDPPWDADVAGLGVSDEGDVYLTDPVGGRVRCVDGACGLVLEAGGFASPAGLVLVPEANGTRLIVAERGAGRLVVLRPASLTLDSRRTGPFTEPTALAVDAASRLYLVDAAASAVVRLYPGGNADDEYGSAMRQHTDVRPHALAIDEDGTLLVTDTHSNAVLRFDDAGGMLGALPGLPVARPRAITRDGRRLFVADAQTGRIHAYDLRSGVDLGRLEGFRGPVLAMAGHEGDLLVSTASGRFARLPADSAVTNTGELVCGPLDAGSGQTWERVIVTADVPDRTAVRLDVALLDDSAASPASSDWLPAVTLDTLVPPPTIEGHGASSRYLWLRVRLVSADRRATPRLSQVEAVSEATSYLATLPAIYAQEDGERGFLRRWLALFRAEIDDTERLLDDMPRRFDPVTTPVDHLAWLAEWLAFDLPDQRETAELRRLVARAHELHTRRATARGLREAIAIHTGLQVEVLEAHRERRVWQLGVTSRLGFDTGLPPGSAEGIVVPDPANTESAGGLVVGDFVVGESRPLDQDDFGEPLFDDAAHLFTVVVPAGQTVTVAARRTLEAVIEANKPAHTDYHLCLMGPDMRVGFQARVGIDSIVAGPHEPMILGDVRLGHTTYLGDANEDEPAGRVGSQARVGIDTILG